MPGPAISGNLQSHRYFDTVNGGANFIPPYQVVSMLTSAQLATYAGSGAFQGSAVRSSPVFVQGTSTILDRPIGISEHIARHTRDLAVRVDGISHVMASEAVAYGNLVSCGLVEQRTSAQSPLVDLWELDPLVAPGAVTTCNLSMVNDVTLTPQSSTASQLALTVGQALEDASAKYQLIRVKLDEGVFYL